jgi:eukaryotic-like serine/threonine-protein kinase
LESDGLKRRRSRKMPVDTLKPNSKTFGDYDVISQIAEGGMGTVYKARHRLSGILVAIKVLSPQMSKNLVLRRRLEQEYNAARTLDHPNIVAALAFSNEGAAPYLVMEYVDGQSLGERIEKAGALEEHEAINIITQVAHGLLKAHRQGLVHRDVKPDNILVTKDGVAKLTDLGLVKELEADLNLTRTGRGLGTPHFMSPEQFRNAKNADARCDIYSLGATLYQMVTGELPFKGCGPVDCWMKKLNNDLAPPRDLVPILSDRIDWAIRRAMSSDPQQRPASCQEFIEDLTGKGTRKLTDGPEDESIEVWYLYYKDEHGVVHTSRGTLNGVRQSLRDWCLGSITDVRVAREPSGPFEPLRDFAEFRDLVVEPTPMGSTSGSAKPMLTNTPVADHNTSPDLRHLTPPPPSKPTSPPLPPIKVIKQPSSKPTLESLVDRRRSDPYDSFKWFLVLVVALFTGMAGFFLLPFLRSLRLM